MLFLAKKVGFIHNCPRYRMPTGIAGLSCLIGSLSHRSSVKHVRVSSDASCGYFTVPWASELRRLGHPSQVAVVFSLPQLVNGGLYASIIHELLNLFCPYTNAHQEFLQAVQKLISHNYSRRPCVSKCPRK